MAEKPRDQPPAESDEAYLDMPKLSTRVSTDLKRRLKIAAAVHDRTESSIVIEAVEAWLTDHPTP